MIFLDALNEGVKLLDYITESNAPQTGKSGAIEEGAHPPEAKSADSSVPQSPTSMQSSAYASLDDCAFTSRKSSSDYSDSQRPSPEHKPPSKHSSQSDVSENLASIDPANQNECPPTLPPTARTAPSEPNEKAAPSDPNEKASPSDPNEKAAPSDPNEKIAPGDPTVEIASSGATRPKAPSAPPMPTRPGPSVLSFVMVGVHRGYRRFGLARRLVEKSMRIARELGCSLIKCEAAAGSSQRMYEQMGFISAKEIKHANWLREDGKQVFNCDDGTTSGKLMLFKL